jgi:hypothetical protein
VLFCAIAAVFAAAPLPFAAPDVPVLENARLRVEADPASAAVRLLDKQTGEAWELGSPSVVFTDEQVAQVKPLGAIRRGVDTLSYSADPQLEFQLHIEDNPPALAYNFSGPFVPFVGKEVQEVHLLHESLAVGRGGNRGHP